LKCFIVQKQVVDVHLEPRVRYKDIKIPKGELIATVQKLLESMPHDATINGTANRITTILSKACEQLLPTQGGARKNRPPWWNKDITASRSELKRVHRVMLRFSTPEAREGFRTARNRHAHNICTEKKDICGSSLKNNLSGATNGEN